MVQMVLVIHLPVADARIRRGDAIHVLRAATGFTLLHRARSRRL